MSEPVVVVDQKYLDFLDFSLTTIEKALVQNLEAPLSVDEVRQQFPDLPAIIRIISGYALIWAGLGKIVVADLNPLLEARTVNLFYGYKHGGRETVAEIKQLLGNIETYIYGAPASI